MNKLALTLGAAALSLAAVSSAQAATREEAQSMLKTGLTEIKAKGMDAAAKEFSAGGSWNNGTLYVFVSDFKANIVAHSANEKLVGKNLWEVKDAGGRTSPGYFVSSGSAAPCRRCMRCSCSSPLPAMRSRPGKRPANSH